ncbi:MAG: hypothetical protein GSR85_04495 [Desulfurococcales archaeon]|nr:hypothetical protein [Desulfurococcales archaeon]
MARLELIVEASKSRSGLHAERKLALIVDAGGRVRRVDERVGAPSDRVYSRGYSRRIKVELKPGEFGVQVRLVKNSRGHVKGAITVYSHKGDIILEAVMRRRKIRLSRGDPSYSWIVERVIEYLGLGDFIRRYNWGTGVRT